MKATGGKAVKATGGNGKAGKGSAAVEPAAAVDDILFFIFILFLLMVINRRNRKTMRWVVTLMQVSRLERRYFVLCFNRIVL